MQNKASIRVAFCGLSAALMLVVMLLGTMVPFSTFLCPGIAGALSIPVLWEFGLRPGMLLYAAVSILSLILAPDKEAAFLFVFLLGWYPILRPKLQPIRKRPLRGVVKWVIFAVAICAVYALLLFVFTMPELTAEMEEWTLPILTGLLLLGSVTFLCYDILLGRLQLLYVARLRPKLFSRNP